MADYLISAWAPEDTDWSDDGPALARRLQSELGAELTVYADGDHGWQYHLNGPDLNVTGDLGREGDVLTVDGGPDEAARMAVWFRDALVSQPSRGLQFYDQTYTQVTSVDPGASASELVRRLGLPDDDLQ